MKSPLVSIIIPVYNSEEYLEDTILSALNQTWAHKEIIIIDDGSTDGSLAIAQSYSSRDVHVFHQHNKGASAARNKGLREAKGDFIQFLDADDLLSPEKIAEQVIALSEKPGWVANCSTIHFNVKEEPWGNKPSLYEESFLISGDPVFFLTNLYGGFSGKSSMVSIHAWLVPKTIIDLAGPWNEELSVNDDGEYFCRIVLKSSGVIKVKGSCYYRKAGQTATLSLLKTRDSFVSAIKAWDLIQQELTSYLDPVALHNCFYRAYQTCAIQSFPQFDDISREAALKSKQVTNPLLKKNDILIGGQMINFISRNISWRVARYIQYYFRYIIRKK